MRWTEFQFSEWIRKNQRHAQGSARRRVSSKGDAQPSAETRSPLTGDSTRPKMGQKGLMSEFSLHTAVVDYLMMLETKGLLRFCHVPNGGHLSEVYGAKVKRMGARAGVPDLLVELKGGRHFWVELKTGESRLSPEQRWWKDTSNWFGTKVYVCRSFEEVKKVLTDVGVSVL